METLMEKNKQVHDEQLFNVSTLTEEGIVLGTASGCPALISFDTLEEAIKMIEEKNRKEEQNKKLVSGGLTITFEGVIDCNTEVKLEHLNEGEVTGIKKFIDALVNARCSYVHTYKLTTERNLLDTDISEENAEPNNPV